MNISQPCFNYLRSEWTGLKTGVSLKNLEPISKTKRVSKVLTLLIPGPILLLTGGCAWLCSKVAPCETKTSGNLEDRINSLSTGSLSKLPYSQKRQIEKLLHAVTLHPHRISKFIKEYRITDEDLLFEIALIAQKDSYGFSRDLRNFKIKNKEKLLHIAKLEAHNTWWNHLSAFFLDYGIQSEDHRIEIAKIAAEHDPINFAPYIRNYRIQNQKELIEIVNILEKKPHFNINEYIHLFGIKSKDELFEIAKRQAAREMTLGFSEYIKNYDIKDPMRRFELAKIVAKENSRDLTHIKEYEIKNEEQLFEIAKIIAKDGFGISKFIHNFQFQSQNYLVEIAKIEVRSYCFDPADLKNFGILNLNDRYEIAKIAAERGSKISEKIKEFNIHDQDFLFEIAKIAAANSWSEITSHIKEYGISDPLRLYEIAKIAAKASGNIQIENFEFSEEMRYQIAQIAVQNSYFKAEGIKKYRLNSNYRFEIAKQFLTRIVTIYQWDTVPHEEAVIDKYKREPSVGQSFQLSFNQEVELFLDVISKTPMHIQTWIARFGCYQENSQLVSKFFGLQMMFNPQVALNPNMSSILEPLIKLEKEKDTQEVKDALRQWMGYLLFKFETMGINTLDQLQLRSELVEGMPLFKSIMLHHNHSMRHHLTNLFFQCLQSENKELFDLYLILGKFKLQETHQVKKIKKQEKIVTKTVTTAPFKKLDNQIFRLLFAHFIYMQKASSVGNWDKILNEWKPAFSIIQANTYDNANTQISIVKCLFALAKEKIPLTLLERNQLLRAIFTTVEENSTREDKAKLVNRNLQLMESFIQLKNGSELKNIVSQMNEKQIGKLPSIDILESSLLNFLKQLLGEGEIKEFSEKFEKIFLKARQPFAFFSYVSTLQTLPDNEKSVIMPVIKQFYQDLMENQFPKSRYSTNPASKDHLHTIFAWRNELQSIWTKGSSTYLKDLSLENKKALKPKELDIKNYLIQRICVDNHVSLFEYMKLSQCSINTDRIDESLKELSEEETNANLQKTDKARSKSQVQLEILLIKIIDNRINVLDKIPLINSAIDLAIKVYSENHQFVFDLKDLRQNILLSQKNPENYEDWKVEETDSWEDLLLCGTEILGSCQSIKGNASLNKCLLNYIVDGKNRVVVIKNSKGIIRARAILRILWDKTLERPVLFRERIYETPGIPNNSQFIINEICKNKARDLEISLITSDFSTSETVKRYSNDVYSLNGKAPFEYVDANAHANNAVGNGNFTIESKHTEILYDHPEAEIIFEV